ncbi:unnamed protein product [Penicillium glandicola]
MSSDNYPNREISKEVLPEPQLADQSNLQLWHSHRKNLYGHEPPRWKQRAITRATDQDIESESDAESETKTETETEGLSEPKNPNLGPFPDFPPIFWTEDYWTRVWDRAIVPDAKRGYQMTQMSAYKKERCKQCRFAMWGKKRGKLMGYSLDSESKQGCWGHPGKPSGRRQRFKCCGGDVCSPGCKKYKDHKILHNQEAWKREWELHEAPENPVDYRYAVVLDCEMGTTDLGEQELIRVSAVDFYTGELLMNKLVFPKAFMLHTNSRFSGVTWPMLYAAKEAGEALNGRDEARERLFRYVGPNTILVAGVICWHCE